MISIHVKKQSNYPVSAPVIKKDLKNFLKDKGLVSDFTVDVSLVGEEAMKELAEKFLGEKDSVHNVLSFPESEVRGEFGYPPKLPLPLGEIVVCFPKALEEAKEEGVLINTKVSELVLHGALHLLGVHHD